MNMSFRNSIVVDNFAGGGGASAGIANAMGRSVDIAINHNPVAISMHRVNHPDTTHYCESVWDVDPVKAANGRHVSLLWLSPDCCHHSKARGGKPADKNIRGLAWLALRWVAGVRPDVIALENVEEFKDWGPLNKSGRPDKTRKGNTFRSYVNALRRNGYEVEWQELRACDYGVPTSRKRLFLIARCDGNPIIWPEPTHGKPSSPMVRNNHRLPWIGASEIINWDIPVPSIFERRRPLAENTMRRIAKGMQRFVLDNPNPFIVRIGQTNFAKDGQQYGIDVPVTTITSKAEHCLTIPFLSKYYGGNYNGCGSDLEKPLPTVTAIDHNSLISVPIFKSEPCSLFTHERDDHTKEVNAFILKYYSTNVGHECSDPLQTITSKHRFGLVTIQGTQYQVSDIGLRMLEPRELFRAHGFPDSYIIDHDIDGKSISKKDQIAMCGNSVPPRFAELIVRCNLPWLCPSEAQHDLDLVENH